MTEYTFTSWVFFVQHQINLWSPEFKFVGHIYFKAHLVHNIWEANQANTPTMTTCTYPLKRSFKLCGISLLKGKKFSSFSRKIVSKSLVKATAIYRQFPINTSTWQNYSKYSLWKFFTYCIFRFYLQERCNPLLKTDLRDTLWTRTETITSVNQVWNSFAKLLGTNEIVSKVTKFSSISH